MKLHFYQFQHQHAITVIIVHGLLGNGRNWRARAQALSEVANVIVPDLRNHGRSAHGSGSSFDHYANDIIELIDKLKVGRCVVAGHSLGGKVVMQMALNDPERIRGLVVVDMAVRRYVEGNDIIAPLLALDLSRY